MYVFQNLEEKLFPVENVDISIVTGFLPFQMEFFFKCRGSKKVVEVEGDFHLDQLKELIKKDFSLVDMDSAKILPQVPHPIWHELVDLKEGPKNSCKIYVNFIEKLKPVVPGANSGDVVVKSKTKTLSNTDEMDAHRTLPRFIIYIINSPLFELSVES